MTFVNPYVVCDNNRHAMTLAMVHEKNTHAMTLVDPCVGCGKEHTYNDSSAGFSIRTHMQ